MQNIWPIIGVCILVFLGILLGVYFSNSTCPNFGYKCESTLPEVSVTPEAAPVSVSQTPVAAPVSVSQTPVAAPVSVSQTPVAYVPSTPVTGNPYISTPPAPPPTSLHGLVTTQTVRRPVHIHPNSITAPTPNDTGVNDGNPIISWNIPNLKSSAYLRFDGRYIMKVRNVAYYNFYGYWIDSNGNPVSSPYTDGHEVTSFEIGNWYP
jgi:hypothetical protein